MEKPAPGYGPSLATMNLSLSHTFVIVDDQDKALAFYRDVLGLAVHTDAPLGEMRWLTVSPSSQPNVEIALVTAEMGHSPEDAAALKLLRPRVYWQPDIRHRRRGGHLRSDPGVRRRGAPGAHRPALRGARLCLPRPVRQPPALLPAALSRARWGGRSAGRLGCGRQQRSQSVQQLDGRRRVAGSRGAVHRRPDGGAHPVDVPAGEGVGLGAAIDRVAHGAQRQTARRPRRTG